MIQDQVPPNQKADWLSSLRDAYYQERGRTREAPRDRVLRLLETTSQITVNSIGKKVIETLEFPEMSHRYDRIESAHARTFEWIYQNSAGARMHLKSFSEWLRSGEDLYWITGKAGSGKSTIMKLIASDPRTAFSLQQRWAPRPYLVARFFFWNAGKRSQKSQEGLLRTLLLQCLLEYNESLITKIAPRRWETRRLFGWDDTPWEWEEMLACLRAFLKITKDSHGILFLIDGLDEFDGDHSRLISLIGILSEWSHVKTCVSSRPWMVFEDAYKQKPSLKMEDLTAPDIHLYVSDKFADNQGFLDLQRAAPQYAQELIMKVEERAAGVFLWVALVVKELLRGLTRGAKLQELDETLHSLPDDLEALFQKMLHFGGPGQFQKASCLFQLVELRRTLPISEEITLLDLAFADEDQYKILLQSTTVIPEDQQNGIASRMRRRLDDACKGLLEIRRSSSLANAKVEYLHRTVQDYLLREDTWTSVLKASPESFNPSACWSQAYLQKQRTFETLTMVECRRTLHLCFFFLKKAEFTGYPDHKGVLAAVEKTAQELNLPSWTPKAVIKSPKSSKLTYAQDQNAV